jgi:hypothetical protein
MKVRAGVACLLLLMLLASSTPAQSAPIVYQSNNIVYNNFSAEYEGLNNGDVFNDTFSLYLDSLTDGSQSNLRVHYVTGNNAVLSIANFYVHKHGPGYYFIDEIWQLGDGGTTYTNEYEGTIDSWVNFSLIFNQTGSDCVVTRYQGGMLQWQHTFLNTHYDFASSYYGAFGNGAYVTDYQLYIDDISITDKGATVLEDGFETSFPNIATPADLYNWYSEGDICPSTIQKRTGSYSLAVPKVGGFAVVTSDYDLISYIEWAIDSPRVPGYGMSYVTPWNVTTMGSHTWSVSATSVRDGQVWTFKDWLINGTVSGTSPTKTLDLPVGSTTTIYIEYKAPVSSGANSGGEHPVLPPPQSPPPTQNKPTGTFEALSRTNPLYWLIPESIPEPWRSGIADAMTLVILAYVGSSLAVSFYPALATKKRKKAPRTHRRR